MNSQWEILIDHDAYEAFVYFLDEHKAGGFTAQNIGQNNVWMICYLPEEIRVLAKLKFNITDCPTPS